MKQWSWKIILWFSRQQKQEDVQDILGSLKGFSKLLVSQMKKNVHDE